MKKIIASVVVIAILILPMTSFAGTRAPIVMSHSIGVDTPQEYKLPDSK